LRMMCVSLAMLRGMQQASSHHPKLAAPERCPMEAACCHLG
jgi:hypothetical protein